MVRFLRFPLRAGGGVSSSGRRKWGNCAPACISQGRAVLHPPPPQWASVCSTVLGSPSICSHHLPHYRGHLIPMLVAHRAGGPAEARLTELSMLGEERAQPLPLTLPQPCWQACPAGRRLGLFPPLVCPQLADVPAVPAQPAGAKVV